MHANGPPFSNSFLLLTFLTFRLFSFSFLQVANNVVYNVRGVSIYVENGQELNNLIAGNNVGCPTLDGCYCWDCVPSHSHAMGATACHSSSKKTIPTCTGAPRASST